LAPWVELNVADWTTLTDPRLLRFCFATVGAPDLEAFECCYETWLGYRVRERGHVAPDLAASWGARSAAGRPYVVMSSTSDSDVFIRAVETPAIPHYRPLTTYGWNAIEIIVDDVYGLCERLKSSPFRILDTPHPLAAMPSIHAMQVIGPAQECLYFTMESGDRDVSILPKPQAAVDRPFILVVAGPDFVALHRFYVERFDMKQRPIRASRAGVIVEAQGLGPDDTFPLTTVGLKEHGYLIEIDGYLTGPDRIAGARSVPSGELPFGNAMGSFLVTDLDCACDIVLAPPAKREGCGYAGRPSCTVRGPAGELIELILDN
jgi:catechol 2,3-dioxygenase-like lactoylglutathione lyase family enzyme